MHSLSQRTQIPTQLSRLPLAKFSHTTTSINYRGPLTWSHLFSNGDIIVVFERCPSTFSAGEKVLMKVSRDREMLVRHHVQTLRAYRQHERKGKDTETAGAI